MGHTDTMARRFVLFAAWLGATALAVVVASAAVGTVRTEVTDQPAAAEPFVAATIAAGATTTTITTTVADLSSSSTTTVVDGRDDEVPSTTVASSTTTVGSSTRDDDEDDDKVPTTTVPAQTSTTTSASVTKTYNLSGGTVTISASDPDVRFVGASPAAGYTIEVEDRGPEQVKVEFDGAGGESQFVAKWDSGELLIDIDED